TGDQERLDAAVFSALHDKGLKLVSERSIAEWAVAEGVDSRRFSEAWNSFSIASRIKRADQMVRSYPIQGVPAIAVDGRYLVGGKNLQELLTLADQVIALRRTERNTQPATGK
ncbi:MAG: DsbA family protein, partial [Candidatus Accumulibacter sp.]|nr:DsbA family protein [Accumulibacter sp.]